MFDYFIPLDKFYMYYLKDKSRIRSAPDTSYDPLTSGLSLPDVSYVPSLTPSLETVIQMPKIESQDISESIIREKQQFLGNCVKRMKEQLALRDKIFQENVSYIDEKIVKCESYVLNIRDFFPYINKGVEMKKANLGHMIAQLESEKRQESVRWWGDQVRLYSELMKTLGEYQSATRRYRFLSGE